MSDLPPMESEKVIMASDARDALGDDVPKLQVHDEKVERNVHVDEAIARGIAGDVDDFHDLVNEANEANERERHMSLRTAFRIYPKAIMWSVIISSSIIMEGYDTATIGNYNAFPSFLNVFGVRAPGGSLQIPPSWQNGLSSAPLVGEIFGLQAAGFLSERWGYRWTIITAHIALVGFIFIPFFAKNLTVLLVGELLQGISWGVFQTMTTAYAAEVCPVPLRHYLTAYVNLCWVIGQFISAGVLEGLEHRTDRWGYRIPFAIQWIWPVPIAIGTFLAPESPWWCVRRGQTERARRSLKRLAKSGEFSQRDADRALALIVYTDAMEKQVAKGTSYLDCFRGVEARRTEIVCMTWVAQRLSGTILGGLSSYFYTRAGISTSSAYKLTWGQSGLAALGTIASWFAMDRIGRKTLMIGGLVTLFVLMIIIGCMGIPSHPNTAESWVAGTLVVVLSTVGEFSTGPVVYTIVAEVPSARLRAKSIVLARNAYNIANVAFVTPIATRQQNRLAWNWGPKAAFFWAGVNACITTYLWFRLPETKGRTYAELDILFANKIPAQKFATTRIETLIEGTEEAQLEHSGRHDSAAVAGLGGLGS